MELEKDAHPIFNSILVVTDRRILDKQIRDNIKQFAQVGNVVAWAEHSGDLRKSLDGIFNEVVHNEKLGISNNEELHLFYLAVRGNKFYTEDLQTALYRNIGRYVFSRAALEDFHINDDDDSIISQALKVMSENGEFDAKGTGNELGEMLIYAMLEEMLGARKLMSRVEIDSNPLSNGSECESIHLLSGTDSNGKISYEMVFGASNIIGDMRL